MGQCFFKFCKSEKSCRVHYMSLFGDLRPQGVSSSFPIDTRNCHISPRLILENMFNSTDVPKDFPEELRWSRVEEIGHMSRLTPFTIMNIFMHKDKVSKRFVFLPNGPDDKITYGALLDAYFKDSKYEIKKKGDIINVKDKVNWKTE